MRMDLRGKGKLVHAENVLATNLKRKADADEQKKNTRPTKVSSSAISPKLKNSACRIIRTCNFILS